MAPDGLRKAADAPTFLEKPPQIMTGDPTMGFCTKCGAALQGTTYCVSCGARSDSAAPVGNDPQSGRSAAGVAPSLLPAVAATETGSWRGPLMLSGVLAFVLITVVASLLYIAHVVKKKAATLAPSTPSEEVSKTPASPWAATEPYGPGMPFLKGVAPWTEPSAPDPSTQVPLREGLTIVTAIATAEGDYESIKRITSMTDSDVRFSLYSEVPVDVILPEDYYSHKMTKTTKHFSVNRTVRRKDLRDSHTYQEMFLEKDQELFPGTTAIGTSTEVLNQLKGGQLTNFVFEEPDLGRATFIWKLFKRVEAHPLPFPVLLNGQRVELPALHADEFGESSDSQGHRLPMPDIFFLNDPDNPIALAWNLGEIVGHLKVVQISYETPAAEPQVEQALAQTGRAEVYGIYFDFRSAQIRAESEGVLQQIADVLGKNPEWNLTVEGHTDNIGGDAFNLDLSKKRAEAVKNALVDRYHIAADRLTTEGYGATRPKESNDTIEGRARNRRVELVRRPR
jgi:outer membrane protein OmpA-like peptidoglycan-associated protein